MTKSRIEMGPCALFLDGKKILEFQQMTVCKKSIKFIMPKGKSELQIKAIGFESDLGLEMELIDPSCLSFIFPYEISYSQYIKKNRKLKSTKDGGNCETTKKT